MQKLLKLLEAYQPSDSNELVVYQHMLIVAHNEPRCLYRDSFPAHFTASAWVVNHDDTKVLLMHHRKLDIWLQPGGHCDGNDDVIEVARREVFEETGLSHLEQVDSGIFDIDQHDIPAHRDEPAHQHLDIRFWLRYHGSEDDIQPNEESKELRWFTSTAPDWPNKENGMLRMQKKWLLMSTKAQELPGTV